MQPDLDFFSVVDLSCCHLVMPALPICFVAVGYLKKGDMLGLGFLTNQLPRLTVIWCRHHLLTSIAWSLILSCCLKSCNDEFRAASPSSYEMKSDISIQTEPTGLYLSRKFLCIFVVVVGCRIWSIPDDGYSNLTCLLKPSSAVCTWTANLPWSLHSAWALTLSEKAYVKWNGTSRTSLLRFFFKLLRRRVVRK